MPTDFWRNDQSLNIFRTKPCQRLARDGVCGWRSQCQYSHCLEWPRRQPRRYNYSPELCSRIRIIEGAAGVSERIENNCSAGQRCPWAHSKEEVLFHPHIFKTSLCEEHTTNVGNKQTRNAKKNRCHRYYCPFAHGPDELRTSPLTDEQRQRCLREVEALPSDVCCVVCTRHWLTPSVNEPQRIQEAGALPFDVSVGPSPLLWPKGPQLAVGMPPNPWDVLSTVPNLSKDGLIKDQKYVSPIQKPSIDPFSMPYKSVTELHHMHSLFDGEHQSLTSLRVSMGANDSPAFIDVDLASAGCSVGNRLSTKSPQSIPQQRDLLGEFYYAML